MWQVADYSSFNVDPGMSFWRPLLCPDLKPGGNSDIPKHPQQATRPLQTKDAFPVPDRNKLQRFFDVNDSFIRRTNSCMWRFPDCDRIVLKRTVQAFEGMNFDAPIPCDEQPSGLQPKGRSAFEGLRLHIHETPYAAVDSRFSNVIALRMLSPTRCAREQSCVSRSAHS